MRTARATGLIVIKKESDDSDQHDVRGTNGDAQAGAVANQLAHLLAHRRHQKAVFQDMALALRSFGNFLERLLIQTDDSSNIFF